MAAINVTSLNKIDGQNFPKNACLLSGVVFFKCLTESSGVFTELFMMTIRRSPLIEKQSIPPEYFVLNIRE